MTSLLLALAMVLAVPDAAAQGLESFGCIEDEVCNGAPLLLSGEIVDLDDGLFVVSDGAQSFEVIDLGPASFWKELGIRRPKKGRTVTVEGVTLSCCGETLHVAVYVTVDNQRVQLRDPVTGKPAWEGGAVQESPGEAT